LSPNDGGGPTEDEVEETVPETSDESENIAQVMKRPRNFQFLQLHHNFKLYSPRLSNQQSDSKRCVLDFEKKLRGGKGLKL
jgi:hypothetical protein